MLRIMLQPGITPHDTYLFVDIDGPDWVHNLVQNQSFERMSTYQVVDGANTLVGYRMQSVAHAEEVAKHIRHAEHTRTHTHALPAGAQNDRD